MSDNPFVQWPAIISVRAIALMSGLFSVAREAYGLYSGKAPAHSVFWFCVWTAFATSAFLAWLQEHQHIRIERDAREKAERDLADSSPKLFLEFSKEHANDFTTYSGLFVRNAGAKPAFKIELSSNSINGLGLHFKDMPIERVDPGKRIFVDLKSGREDKQGIFQWFGGGPGVQLDALFDDLAADGTDESFPVDIKYRDYDGNEFVAPCIINRASNFVDTRIWCELIRP